FLFNQVSFHPAYAGTNPYPRFSAGYRDQWPGLGNAYISYYASYDQFIDKIFGGIGVTMNRDEQGNGVFSKTGLDIMYSYPVEINSKILVNLGIQASIIQNSLNATGLVFGDQNPFQPSGQTEVIPNESMIYPDFSAGVSIYGFEQYQLSLTVNHLNTPGQFTGSDNITKVPMRITCQILSQYPSKSEGKETK